MKKYLYLFSLAGILSISQQSITHAETLEMEQLTTLASLLLPKPQVDRSPCASFTDFLGLDLPFTKSSTRGPAPATTVDAELARIAPSLKCNSLRPSDAMLVSIPDHISPTGVLTAYKLTRTDENAYLAEVALDFQFPGSALSPQQVQDTYLERTNRCYEIAEPHLIGANGETLRVRAVDPALRPDVPKTTIQISPEKRRNNRFNWNSDAPCSAIFHESMHLLGLPDTYAEEPSGNRYDCRNPGPANSVMSNPSTFWDATATLTVKVDLCVCKSSVNPELCSSIIERGSLDQYSSCPAEFALWPVQQQVREGEKPRPLKDKPSFVLANSIQVIKTTPATRDRLLFPAEFRSIITPACINENLKFYSCSLNAKRSSSAQGGTGCLAQPSYCRGSDFSWMQ
jgi:hypothetical protein